MNKLDTVSKPTISKNGLSNGIKYTIFFFFFGGGGGGGT